MRLVALLRTFDEAARFVGVQLDARVLDQLAGELEEGASQELIDGAVHLDAGDLARFAAHSEQQFTAAS